MSLIGYAVRGTDGVAQRGTFNEGSPSSIDVTSGNDIALNLRPGDIQSYAQKGSDLHVILANGEVLILEGYFTDSTSNKHLFLSEEGDFVEAVLYDAQGDAIYADYVAIDVGGKWSAYDDLVFLDVERIEPVVAPLILPAIAGLGGSAGLAAAGVGAAAVIGGGGGGGPIVPTVDDPDVSRIIGGTGPDTVTITGTGAPGSTVEVTVGTSVKTVTIGDDGTWISEFDPSELPADGVYVAAVVVTATDGTITTLAGPSVDIDTTAPDLDVQAGTQSVGDLVNGAGHSSGATISGTGEAGATVSVEISGVTHTTTVALDGSWSVLFDASEVATGEYETDVTIVTTDARGNSYTVTEVLVVDTVAPPAAVNTVETDNVINASEASDGITLTGTGEAGASISVEFQGVTHTTTVGSGGTWSVDFGAAAIAAGTYDSTISVTTTDAAGNSFSTTHSVHVDTENGVSLSAPIAGDNVISGAEQSSGVTLSGTAEAGAAVVVTLQGVSHSVTAASNGTWSSNFTASEIPTGEYDATVSVVATDAAGNSDTTSATVRIDTTTGVAIDANLAGGDNIVNAAEAATGVEITGTAEAGSTVQVTVAGVTRSATVQSDGTWSAAFAAGSLPAGEFDTAVSVLSTDAAGNTATATSALRIDTVAGEVALSSLPIEIDDTINAVERADGVDISGTATPGLTVTVALGAATHQVTADLNGNWSSTFAASEVPTGTSTLPITASITDDAGNSRSVSDSVKLDTLVDNHTISAAQVEGDDVVNLAERADGVTLSGTTEPGSTVSVQLGLVTRLAAVDAAGNWDVTFAATDIPTGTYVTSVTATATDLAGNVSTISDSFNVDTNVDNLGIETTQATDDVVNASEHAAGTVLTGTTEPGSVVTVSVQGVTRTADVDVAGNWSVKFSADDLPAGTYVATAVVSATDLAGNTDTVSDTFQVDTVIDTPEVDSVTFSGSDVRRISTDGSPDSFVVNSLETDGTIASPAYTQSSDPVFGTEYTFNTPVSSGTHLVVSSADSSGNASGTLVVLEDSATNAGTIDNAGLARFDIQSLNLDYAADANLTLTEAQIQQLSGTSDTLTISGGTDDSITLSNATKTTETRDIDGETYEVYTIGDDGAMVVVDQDINVII